MSGSTDETGIFYPGQGRQAPDARSTDDPASVSTGASPRPPTPLPEGGSTILSGTVRARAERTEQERVRYPDGHWGETSLTVVVFLLDEFDERGNRIRSVPVEMRGASFSGQLRDGDDVSCRGRVSNGVVHCDLVTLTSSGATFSVVDRSARRPSAGLRKLGLALVVVVAVGFLGVVASVLVASIFHLRLPGGFGDTGSSAGAVMPNVVGEDNVNASELLERAGIDNFLMENVKAPRSKFGIVVRTDPVAGTRIKSGTAVRVYLGN